MLCIIVFLFGTSLLVVAIKSHGLGNMVDNLFASENLNKRIVCIAGGIGGNMTFRQVSEAHDFVQTFNGSSCNITEKI
jgi:hypothetical protein